MVPIYYLTIICEKSSIHTALYRVTTCGADTLSTHHLCIICTHCPVVTARNTICPREHKHSQCSLYRDTCTTVSRHARIAKYCIVETLIYMHSSYLMMHEATRTTMSEVTAQQHTRMTAKTRPTQHRHCDVMTVPQQK